jgi:hypothetical protein
MTAAEFEKVAEQIRGMSPAEQRRLRDLLDSYLVPAREAEFAQEMLREGIFDHVPPAVTDLSPFQDRKPIDVVGKPLSETIIEERG